MKTVKTKVAILMMLLFSITVMSQNAQDLTSEDVTQTKEQLFEDELNNSLIPTELLAQKSVLEIEDDLKRWKDKNEMKRLELLHCDEVRAQLEESKPSRKEKVNLNEWLVISKDLKDYRRMVEKL